MFDTPESKFEFRKILRIVIFSILGMLFVTYITFQARLLIMGPQITLDFEPPTQNTDRVVELKGTTENITHLWLNGRQIFTNERGGFDEVLVLENGYTVTTLRAKDRYGRETELVRSFVYTPATLVKSN